MLYIGLFQDIHDSFFSEGYLELANLQGKKWSKVKIEPEVTKKRIMFIEVGTEIGRVNGKLIFKKIKGNTL